MKLDAWQRRMMLLPCRIAGLHMPDRVWVELRVSSSSKIYLGDLLYINQETLFSRLQPFDWHGPTQADWVFWELLGLGIGTGSDSDTQRAFAEAKQRLKAVIPPERAWPRWYVCKKG